jgi:hypothetical protein
MADTPVIELRGVGKTYYNGDVATPRSSAAAVRARPRCST